MTLPGHFDDPARFVGVVALQDQRRPVAGVDRPLAVEAGRGRGVLSLAFTT